VVLFILPFTDRPAVEKALLVRLVQISFGMILGSSCVILGVILSWLGITASVKMNAEGEAAARARFGLQSTSPGVVLSLGGIVLIAASLYKEVAYKEDLKEGVPIVTPKIPSGM
jgi:hypothetical protein